MQYACKINYMMRQRVFSTIKGDDMRFFDSNNSNGNDSLDKKSESL